MGILDDIFGPGAMQQILTEIGGFDPGEARPAAPDPWSQRAVGMPGPGPANVPADRAGEAGPAGALPSLMPALAGMLGGDFRAPSMAAAGEPVAPQMADAVPPMPMRRPPSLMPFSVAGETQDSTTASLGPNNPSLPQSATAQTPASAPVPTDRGERPAPSADFADYFTAFAKGDGLLSGIANVMGVDKAQAAASRNVQALIDRGFDPEFARTLGENPKAMAEVLPKIFSKQFGEKPKVFEVNGSLVDETGREVYRGNPASKLPPGFTTDANGKLTPIEGGPADPKYLREAAGARKAPPTATEMKAIKEADEDVLATRAAIKTLGTALTKNKEAYSGPLASERGYVTSMFGSNAGEATQDVENLIQTQAIQQLKAVFGGMPTEGERKILLELQGSVNQSPKVREEIWGRAKDHAETRLKLYEDQANQMRDRTYYQPGGGSSGAPQAASQPQAAAGEPQSGAPPTIKGDDDYNALASGTLFYDPHGKPRRKP